MFVAQSVRDLATRPDSVPAVETRSERNAGTVCVAGRVGPPCQQTRTDIRSGRFARKGAGATRRRGGSCGVPWGGTRKVDHEGCPWRWAGRCVWGRAPLRATRPVSYPDSAGRRPTARRPSAGTPGTGAARCASSATCRQCNTPVCPETTSTPGARVRSGQCQPVQQPAGRTPPGRRPRP